MRIDLGPVIQRLYSNKIVRYLFSGGISLLVDILVYNFCWVVWFHKSSFHLKGFTVEGYSMALVVSYFCGSLTSFFLNKFFVFEVKVAGRQQFMKSLLVYGLAFFGNWLFLKLGIEGLHLSPFFSRFIAALTVAFLTFNLHKYFTFKPKP